MFAFLDEVHIVALPKRVYALYDVLSIALRQHCLAGPRANPPLRGRMSPADSPPVAAERTFAGSLFELPPAADPPTSATRRSQSYMSSSQNADYVPT